MTSFDLSCMSDHVLIDRETRVNIIKKTVGFGKPFAETPNKKDPTSTVILTDTGVIVVVNKFGMIITTWIADVKQASAVYKQYSNGKNLPPKMWAIVNYNNNTPAWHRMAA